jgi:hypothetical protein
MKALEGEKRVGKKKRTDGSQAGKATQTRPGRNETCLTKIGTGTALLGSLLVLGSIGKREVKDIRKKGG